MLRCKPGGELEAAAQTLHAPGELAEMFYLEMISIQVPMDRCYLILPPEGLQINELLNLFGSILLVLIGVELLETFKTVQVDKTINVLSVLLVALIGISAIILSLSLGYYLIKEADLSKNER